MSELQENVNSHAEMFSSMAYDVYRDYCQEIEKIAEEIGKDLFTWKYSFRLDAKRKCKE